MIGFIIGIIIGAWLMMYWQKKELKSLSQQIDQINKNLDSFGGLTISHGLSYMSPLLIQINQLLKHYQTKIKQDKTNAQQLRSELMSISHDLRTPLTAISGYLQLFSKTDLTSDQQIKYLTIANERTRYLQRLVENIFYLAKLEQQGVETSLQAIYIHSQLENVLATNYQLLHQKGIQIEVEIESKQTIISDENAVNRILTNVIQNIAHHGQGSATISHTEQDGKIVTEFRNPMIRSENLNVDLIFDRHYTAHTNRSFEHGGLGLTIVKELCQQLNHQIDVGLDGNQFVLTIHWS